MAENIYSCFHYHKKCQEDRQAIEELAPKVLEAADKAAFGNIGDIKYTLRTTVPNGGAWCDGASYGKTQFPDVYNLLADGKLQSVDVATYDSVVSLSGSCGFFGLDAANESFKVPTLSDVYLKAGQEADEFGAESLPNITGDLRSGYVTKKASTSTYNKNEVNGSGAFNGDGTAPSGNAQFTAATTSWFMNGGWTFDASRSSSTYQDGAKVNPDHVTYRAYVMLYTAEKELSIVNWTNQLQSKMEAILAEIDAKAKSIEAPVGTLTPFAGNTAPAGWLKCDGSAVSRTTYANLFAVIGTTYGAGDGSTTFNVPNYSNARFVTSATVAVKGTGMTLGITDGSVNGGLINIIKDTDRVLGEQALYGTNVGSANVSGSSMSGDKSIGLTKDASKSGITGSVSLASACNFIIKH